MNHESKNRYKSGFTIIELIVVISVIGILSVLGIAGFNNYNEAQTLRTATNDVATMLNLAKSRALSQVKLGSLCDPALPLPLTLRRYEVKISMPNLYELIIHCGPDPAPYTTEIISGKTLPVNIIFTSSGSFYFPVITGGIIEASGSPSPWEIELTGYGNTRKIIIDSVGGIKIE